MVQRVAVVLGVTSKIIDRALKSNHGEELLCRAVLVLCESKVKDSLTLTIHSLREVVLLGGSLSFGMADLTAGSDLEDLLVVNNVHPENSIV